MKNQGQFKYWFFLKSVPVDAVNIEQVNTVFSSRPKQVFTNGLRVLNLGHAGRTAMPNPYSLRSHSSRNSFEVGLPSVVGLQ